MYLGGNGAVLTARAEILREDDPISGLDVSLLQQNLLGPILGVRDPRTDARVDFIGGSAVWRSWRGRSTRPVLPSPFPFILHGGADDGRRGCRGGDAAQIHLVRAETLERPVCPSAGVIMDANLLDPTAETVDGILAGRLRIIQRKRVTVFRSTRC